MRVAAVINSFASEVVIASKNLAIWLLSNSNKQLLRVGALHTTCRLPAVDVSAAKNSRDARKDTELQSGSRPGLMNALQNNAR